MCRKVKNYCYERFKKWLKSKLQSFITDNFYKIKIIWLNVKLRTVSSTDHWVSTQFASHRRNATTITCPFGLASSFSANLWALFAVIGGHTLHFSCGGPGCPTVYMISRRWCRRMDAMKDGCARDPPHCKSCRSFSCRRCRSGFGAACASLCCLISF